MGEPIRFRPTWRQYSWWMLLPAAAWLVRAWALPASTPARWFWTSFAVVMVVESGWLMTRGVDVYEDRLLMHGLRRRVIPWHDVERVGPAPFLGSRAVAITVNGRRMRLRSPQHTPFLAPDEDFLAKARTIYLAWERATSAGSAP